jgi:hypothetical protein
VTSVTSVKLRRAFEETFVSDRDLGEERHYVFGLYLRWFYFERSVWLMGWSEGVIEMRKTPSGNVGVFIFVTALLESLKQLCLLIICKCAWLPLLSCLTINRSPETPLKGGRFLRQGARSRFGFNWPAICSPSWKSQSKTPILVTVGIRLKPCLGMEGKAIIYPIATCDESTAKT